MLKIVKKIGNSIGITFNKEEQKIHKIKKDKIINININHEQKCQKQSKEQ